MQTNGMAGEVRLYRNSFDCCAQVVRKEGWTMLFAGLYANIIRSIPGAAIQFWVCALFPSPHASDMSVKLTLPR